MKNYLQSAKNPINSTRFSVSNFGPGEFTVTVDMFYMPCGLNGAIYFVEMDADGGQAAAARTGGANRAGAKYGTGYCDAQCPHDLKFMEGKANVTGLMFRFILGRS